VLAIATQSRPPASVNEQMLAIRKNHVHLRVSLFYFITATSYFR
jgi:hypothetical protein